MKLGTRSAAASVAVMTIDVLSDGQRSLVDAENRLALGAGAL
jgi:hypothetical protein